MLIPSPILKDPVFLGLVLAHERGFLIVTHTAVESVELLFLAKGLGGALCDSFGFRDLAFAESRWFAKAATAFKDFVFDWAY